MRILIINEYAVHRGAEQIVQEQQKIFKNYGYQVKCIYFAFSPTQKYRATDDDSHIIPIPRIGKILFLPHIYLKLRKLLTRFNPEVIILHNIYSSPLTVYKALTGYYVCQIVHDYKIVCPTAYSILLKDNNIICKGYKHNACLRHCSFSLKDSIKLRIRLALVKLNEELRKKYVGKFLAPSSRLCNVMKDYGYESFLLNNPININTPLRLKTSFGKVKKLLYVGGINFEKGILPFVEKILNEDQCMLDIYGGTTKGIYSDKLLNLIENNTEKIRYLGSIDHENLMKKMKDYDFVVVPSLWVDNYPTIILESMANSVSVIASDRGGAKDLLSDGRGLLFEWDNDDSISMCLSELKAMSLEKYNKIIAKAYEYVYKNNSYKAYYDNFINIMGITDKL